MTDLFYKETPIHDLCGTELHDDGYCPKCERYPIRGMVGRKRELTEFGKMVTHDWGLGDEDE